MLRNNLLENRKAQVGETLTWVVATLAIIVLLTLSIYAAIALGKTKVVDTKKTKLKISSAGDDVRDFDRVEVKTIMAYEISGENKNKIDVWISSRELKND